MLRPPPNADPYLSYLVSMLNAELVRLEPALLGVRDDGTTLHLRFRAAFNSPFVRVHVQSNATGEGGSAYASANFRTSTETDCRETRLKDVTIALVAGVTFYVWLIPVQYDGAGLEVRYDGQGGRPDYMTFVAPSGSGSLQSVDGWYQDNVPASQTDVELTRATGRFRPARPGSVTGVVVTMTEARTAGTLTVTVFKNTGLAGAAGATIGLAAVIDGTNTTRKATTQAKDTDRYVAGDELYLVVTTDGAWTPISSDLRAALEVMHG